jgi:hypothetical protein
MKTLLCVVVAFALSGCMALHRPEEYAFQAMQIADYSQTSQIAKYPDRYKEKLAAWAIGEHPSQSSVNEYFIAEALLHLGVSELLLRHGNKKVYASWQVFTIVGKTGNVIDNYGVGLKVKF